MSANGRAVLAIAFGLCGCNSGGHEAAAEPMQPRSAQAVASSAPAPAASAEWEAVRLDDQAPLCVFADHVERGNAPFLKDVHAQTLRAGSRLVFGTFAPGCQNEACDARPTMSCWVEQEATTVLVVHSRLTYDHKRGAICSEECRPVIAGCETNVLATGKYSVKYGGRTFEVRVPSVVKTPCLESNLKAP